MKTFIKEWMEKLNYTIDTLSEESGISTKIIERWFNNTCTPSVAQLDIIAKTLNVSMDKLVRIDPNIIEDIKEELSNEGADDLDNIVDGLFDSNSEPKENNKKGVSDTYGKPSEEMLEKDPGLGLVMNLKLKEWLEILRVRKNKIIKDLSIPAPIFEDWLENRYNPSLLQAKALSEYLGISIDDLVSPEPYAVREGNSHIHIFETHKYNWAVRSYRYLKYKGIDSIVEMEVVSVEGDVKGISYKVIYEHYKTLNPLEFILAYLLPKYRDPREKSKVKKDKIKGISVNIIRY